MPKTLALPTDDPGLFRKAVSLLNGFSNQTSGPLTGNFAVAIAVLMHRRVAGQTRVGPPELIFTPGDGDPISTGALQTTVCDRTYEKLEPFLGRGHEGPIFKILKSSFKPRSPSANNWRNSFDLQGGLGCDAPYTQEYLLSNDYLAEPRFDCPFRDPNTAQCTSPAGLTQHSRTCFNPNKKPPPPGPYSKAAQRPKLLHRGYNKEGAPGFWFVEPNEVVLANLLSDVTNRVPLYPFAVGVYAGSPYFDAWGNRATRERLQADLYLDDPHFLTIFDPSLENPYNAQLLKKGSKSASVTPAAKSSQAQGGVEPHSAPTNFKDRSPGEFKLGAEGKSDPIARLRCLEKASRGHARALSALALQLKKKKLFPLEQLDGFDLYVATGKTGRLFEIKTWNDANLMAQIRTGLAQLYEYRWRNRTTFKADVSLYLVLDRPPPANIKGWLWEYLANDRGVTPCWMEDGTLRTFGIYAGNLSWLYGKTS